MTLRDVIRRALCIAALMASFVVIGAPGGGGHGGGFGGGGFGGGYYGGNRSGSSGSGEYDPNTIKIAAAVCGVFLVGVCTWVVSASRKPRPEGPGATVRVTVAALLDGNAAEQVAFFNTVLKRTDFATPRERTAALNRVLAYMVSLPIRDGFVETQVHPDPAKATDEAERLGKQQTRCVDGARQGEPAGNLSCLAGFTISTTAARAGRFSVGGRESVAVALQALSGMSSTGMDAFYLFYAPAPGDALPQAQAEKMLDALRAISAPSASKTG